MRWGASWGGIARANERSWGGQPGAPRRGESERDRGGKAIGGPTRRGGVVLGYSRGGAIRNAGTRQVDCRAGCSMAPQWRQTTGVASVGGAGLRAWAGGGGALGVVGKSAVSGGCLA